MPSERDLPTRDQNHSRSSWSTREFSHLLPRDWVVHSIDEDYGIDLRVEVFEDGRTTGVFFNVQLKSTDQGSGHQPASSIKRTTLNYWNQTPDATLVVIAHDSTETLWYRWAHLLPHDENPDTKSRQVRCEDVLDRDSASELAEEARAWRLARELSRHLPIDVRLTGTTLYGESATHLKRAIASKLSTLPSYFRVTHSTAQLPYFSVSIEDDRVMAGLRGNYVQQITWGLHGERDYSALAADVIASLALSCASVGAEDLCVLLLRIAAVDTHTLIEADALGYAVNLLVRREENETVLTLVRRASEWEGRPVLDFVLAAVASAGPSPSLARAVAHITRDAARASENPAKGLYNAGNLLRGIDGSESIALYEEAAVADPSYLQRPYWWREKGATYWDSGDFINAEQCYRQAIELGDHQSRAYLGDVLLRTGRYREALEAFSEAPIWENPHDAQWRLTHNAASLIVEDLGIERQDRPEVAIPDFYPELTDDSTSALERTALDAIHADALNAWAYSALAAAWVEDDQDRALSASATAAVLVNTDATLWINLVIAVIESRSSEEESSAWVGADAFICAQKYMGDEFVDHILDDPLLTDEARAAFIELYEGFRLPSPPMEVRDYGGGADYESIFIPTDRRG